MADTSVTYVGDGATLAFNVPFEYIAQAYVVVEINSVIRDTPADYYWSSPTQITFTIAPSLNDGILFRRVTPGDTRLVDFQNGAVLTEQDLDLAIDQIFHLSQEAKENYADLLYAEMVRIGTALGITSTDPETWLASAVDTMLATPAADELQQGLADIATNGEGLLDHTDILQLLGDANAGRTAFTIDEVTTLVDGGATTMAAKFSALVAADGDALAAVAVEAQARIDADDVTASLIALIGAENVGQSAFIINSATVKIDSDSGQTLGAVLANYSIVLDVNGYMSGFELLNDGTTASFKISADDFLIIDPAGGPAQAGEAVFRIVGGVTYIKEAHIQELTVDKLIDGSITADMDLTTGNLTISSTGFINAGQTDYDTGDGFFLGRSGGATVFSIGKAAGQKLTWDGTDLVITGFLDATGIVGGNSKDDPFQIQVDGTELANIAQTNHSQVVGSGTTGIGTAFSGTTVVYSGTSELVFWAPEDAASAGNPRYRLAHREQPIRFNLTGDMGSFSNTDFVITLEYRYNETGGWTTATTYYSYCRGGSQVGFNRSVEYHPKSTTYNTIAFRIGVKQNASTSAYYKYFALETFHTNLGKNSGSSGGALL